MLFNSVHFLIFFPIVTVVYFLVPQRWRWAWLLAASYYFYMAWNPRYALLMLASTAITYLSGLLIQRAGGRRRRRVWVALSFASNLAILFFFKYFDFALENLNTALALLGMRTVQPAFDVLLPVGISFYTFQALSYTMDVYRGEIAAQRHFGKYALFVSFFPQLVAGPIERSKHLLPQFDEVHHFEYERVKNGLIRMAWGFFEKLVVADRAALMANQVYGNYTQYEGLQLVLGTLAFAVQIYCDFAGYSDIAIGAAKVMGFDLMENFRQPYLAKSIREFWSRWHISLSTWFKDYLYIPLGGNRKGTARKYLNVLITFVASGLWHGASWAYVIWGGLHGLYQIIGDVTAPLRKRVAARLNLKGQGISYWIGRNLLTLGLVCFAWIFFRAPGAGAAFTIIGRMFQSFNYWIFFDGSIYGLGLGRGEMEVLVIGVLVLYAVDRLRAKGSPLPALARQSAWFRWAGYGALVFVILMFGVYGDAYAQSQFIYFQF